ncbi:PREDICTED: uncharacterized protein LOC108363604 [Rhagoletis zephyria]|uniref:uncharacterized protein LOC108363604 n=1 Tax=Rhagoletis zephyria TaxID=28612 RepID=UPI00081170A9|nr:PREDICTED: uncharacterized protein LOC108363604 [Rhagoletis zephyria]
MSCFPRQSECCCCSSCCPCYNYMADCSSVRRNRSCSDCFPTRLSPDMQIPAKKTKSRPLSNKPSMPKLNGKRASQVKNGQRINLPAADGGPSIDPRSKPKCQSDPKQTKNKQNFQYQNLKKHMEVISEEAEHDSDDDGQFSSKKIQNSCADFLTIVHDTVLETVQSSVECMLRNYFVHTMEKMETLCSQMMRNECLLSKMYLDILDKFSQQNEKSMRHLKFLCQFIAETQKETSEERAQNQRCNCQNCGSAEEEFVSLAGEQVLTKGRPLSGSLSSNSNRNGDQNVYKGEQNSGLHRDSDTEPKTDSPLTSSTNSLPHAKFKSCEIPHSNTNKGNEEIRENIGRISEYSDSKQLGNSNGHRNSELPRIAGNCQTERYANRMEGGRYFTVKTGPSNAAMLKMQP